MKYKAFIKFCGSRFHGWQIQPQQRTVQGETERILSELFAESVRIFGAGRTDAGVHALNMCFHFSAVKNHPPELVFRVLKKRLPQDADILKVEAAPENFSARYDARFRQYIFWLSEIKLPFFTGLYTPIFCNPDWKIINQILPEFIGNRDFSSFCVQNSLKDNNYCEVYHLGFTHCEGNHFFTITANRFLHKMVRSITGTLLDFGCGKISSLNVMQALEGENRSLAGDTLSPDGLCLAEIGYEIFSPDRLIRAENLPGYYLNG